MTELLLHAAIPAAAALLLVMVVGRTLRGRRREREFDATARMAACRRSSVMRLSIVRTRLSWGWCRHRPRVQEMATPRRGVAGRAAVPCVRSVAPVGPAIPVPPA